MNVNIRTYPLLSLCCLVLPMASAMAEISRASWLSDPLLASPPLLETVGDHGPPCQIAQNNSATIISLATALDMALCFNPQSQDAWASIRQYSAQRGEARAAYLPNISASISRQQQQSRYPATSSQMDTSITTDSRYASLTWRLLDFGGREARLQAADHMLSAALASRDAIVQKIMRDVIAMYFSAQSAQAEREARAEGKNIAQEILAMAKRRELQGLAAHTDSLQAATALAKAELELARATANADKTSLALALQLGLPQRMLQIPRIPATDVHRYNVIQKDLSAWQALASEQHPAIVAAYAQWQAAKEQYKATRADGLPVLEFSHSRYLNGRPNQELNSRQSRESVTGLTLSIPLFEGFGRHYKQQGALAQIAQKEAQWQETRNQVLHDISQTYSEATASLLTLEASGRLLRIAEETMQAIQRKYANGLADTQEILNAQAGLADARQERVRTLAEWRSAQLRLLTDAGKLRMHDVE